MPHSSKYDALQILQFERLGYNALTKALDPTPRLVSGSQDCFIHPDGTIKKRPAFRWSDLGTFFTPVHTAVDGWGTLNNDLDNVAYVKTRTSVTANSAVGPDVAGNADKVFENSDTGLHFISRTAPSTTNSTNQTFVSYWKSSDYTRVAVQMDNKAAATYQVSVSLTDGSVLASSGTGSVSIRKEPSSWWRIAITMDSATGGSTPAARAFILRNSDTTPQSYAGDNASGVFSRGWYWLTDESDTSKYDKRCERLWLYETIENPAKVYVLGSWKELENNTYQMYYVRIGTSLLWTSVGTTREVDNSDEQHEVGIGNGLAYIKAFPDSVATSEFLGTTIFDGTDASLKIWGTLGPTTAAAMDGASGTWGATAGTTDVQFGWLYTYSWITETGHVSNRAAFAPPAGQGQLSASNTGAFSNRIPDVDLAGDADTTGLPTVQVWRSLDGGGVFAALEQVSNPGAGTFEYLDDSGGAGAGDPVTDFEIDTANLAPSLTSNSPPPAVNYPLVTGTDNIARSTAIAEYAGRFWYAMGNILHFSGFEEILNGIPHESWPSGLKGNFIRFKNPIRFLIATSEALYVVTNTNVLWIRGFDRASFRVSPLFEQLGGAEGQQAAGVALRNVACFLTEDNQIALVRGEQAQILSGPLGEDLTGAISANTEVQLSGYFFKGSGWIVVGLRDTSDSTNSRIWTYDLQRNQWNPPWIVPFSAIASGRVRASDSVRELVVATHEAEGPRVGVLEFDQVSDELAGGDSEYAPVIQFNLVPPPGGNHLNLLRVPAAFPSLQKVKIERTKFASDTDPTIAVRLDDFDTDAFTTLGVEPPDMLASPSSYAAHWCAVDEAAQRAQVKITAASEAKDFELQTMGLLWHPGAGS